MSSPIAPTIMRITPTVDSLMPETDAVTANFRIAPTAMRKMEVPMPMDGLYPTSITSMQTATDVYAIPQELLDFRDTIRQIVTERIAPRAAEIDAKAEYPWDVRRLLAEQDILGLPFAEEYGGTGTGTLMLQMAVEEIAKACASSALILMIQELGTLPIQLYGSDELKQRLLPKCASGEWSPAFALSEPEAGSDPGAMRTTAVADGDEWVINGAKNWITNSGIADFYVVFAVTDRESRRITAFVVESDRPGLSIGKLEHKLGIKGSPTGSPVFEDVRVPRYNVIGEVGRGLSVALGTLQRTRLGAAAQVREYASWLIDDILDALELDEAPVIGHSLGGMFALWHAAAGSERISEVVVIGEPAVALPGVRVRMPLSLLTVRGLCVAVLRSPSPHRAYRRMLAQGQGSAEIAAAPDSLIEVLRLSARRPGNARTVASLMHAIDRFRRPRPRVS